MNRHKLEYQNKLRSRKKKIKQAQKGKHRTEILAEMVDIEKRSLLYESHYLKNNGFVPGVYFLFKGIDLVYIGESQCIMPRICQHYGQKNFDAYRIYAVMPIENERKRLEKKLIRKHRPILNTQHNDNLKFKEDKRQIRG